MEKERSDKQVRHQYIMTLAEFKELQFRVNPGNIKLYEACFGAEGLAGELVTTLDRKVTDVLQNRVKMGLQAIEVQIEQEKVRMKQPKKSIVGGGRISKFLKNQDRSIIEEDEEFS